MSPAGGRFEVDDHESYGRPARRTRPRTKQRPSYDDATLATVITIDRGRYTCLVEQLGERARAQAGRVRRPAGASEEPNATASAGHRQVTAMKARTLGRQSIVVGDRVKLVGDVSGEAGTLARIVDTEPRATVLRRTADDDDPIERVIVANADQLVMVVALADPPPRPRLIDRCLVAAYDAGVEPLLCLTKADLGAADELLEMFRPLGVPAVVTQRDGDLDPLRERLTDRVSVLVGHSGVGKSTLVNALVPGAGRAIGEVSAIGRGRHTSTQALMLELPFGDSSWIVDTPGLRSFGLAHVDPDHLIRAFPDLDEAAEDCPRGCTHTRTEPECALDDAVAEGRLDPARVDSYRRLLDSRERHTGD